MREQKLYSKRKNSRLIIAFLLLATSIAVSIGFSIASQRGTHFWVASQALTPGTLIEPSLIELRTGHLGASQALYFDEDNPPLGLTAERFFAPGEVIAQSGLAEQSDDGASVLVPLSIRSVDIPESAKVGDRVTLFWVLDGRGEQLFEPEEIARNIYIQSLDRRGSNFGSDLALSVSVTQAAVQKLLSFTSGGRIVVVPSHA